MGGSNSSERRQQRRHNDQRGGQRTSTPFRRGERGHVGTYRAQIQTNRPGLRVANGLTVSDLFLGALEEAHLERALAISRMEYEREPQGPPPTKPEILQNLQEVCLDMLDLKDGNDKCCICMEDQRCGDLAVKLFCGHAFHKGCILPWLQKHNTCPVCRLELNSLGREQIDEQRQQHQQKREQRRKVHEQQLLEQRRKMQEIDADEKKLSPSKSSDSTHANALPECSKASSNKSSDPETSSETNCKIVGENGYGFPPEKRPKHVVRNSGDGAVSAVVSNPGATGSGSSTISGSCSSGTYPSLDFTKWSVHDLKATAMQLGLNASTQNVVEKSELISCINKAADFNSLMKLSVSELQRRRRYLGIVNDSIEKQDLVNSLISKVKVVLDSKLQK
mmetsp:Transcript_5548/g.6347  ORF Transcript_5548/g.6347 Transcript_5548/m.6347 type:complete len:392 (-) Transcript_5548:293-1468(-)